MMDPALNPGHASWMIHVANPATEILAGSEPLGVPRLQSVPSKYFLPATNQCYSAVCVHIPANLDDWRFTINPKIVPRIDCRSGNQMLIPDHQVHVDSQPENKISRPSKA
jgi:hypothetical protein